MALLCRMVTEVVRTIAATASAFRIAILVICISIFGFSLKPFYNHTIHTPSSPRILGSLQRPCLTVVSLSTFLRGTHRGAAAVGWCIIALTVAASQLVLGCARTLWRLACRRSCRSEDSAQTEESYRGGVSDVLSDAAFFPYQYTYNMPRLLGGMRAGSPDVPPRGRELPRTPTDEHPLAGGALQSPDPRVETPDPRVMRVLQERERASSMPAPERPGPPRARVEDAALQVDRAQRFELSETPAGGFGTPPAQWPDLDRDVRRVLNEQQALQAEVSRLRRESVTPGDIQAMIGSLLAQQAGVGGAAAPAWRHRPSIAERVQEDDQYQERLPGVSLTEAPSAVESYLPKRVPETPQLSGLSKLPLAQRLELLWLWLEKTRNWVDASQSSGPQLWKCMSHAFGDYVSCWIDRAETPEQASFTLEKGLWKGGPAGESAAGWCSNSFVWLHAALDEESAQEFDLITRGQNLNPFQRACAVYIAPLLRHGFQDLQDVKSVVLKIQRPALFLEGKDGSTWHAELLRWKSLRQIYELTMSASLGEQVASTAEGWKDVNPLWVVHSLREVVEKCASMCNVIEIQAVLDTCKNQRIFSTNPLPGSGDVLADSLIALFSTSRTIKAYKKPAKAHAATRELAPKEQAPKATPKDAPKDAGKASPPQHVPTVPLTREQQSLQDRAKAGFAAYHNRDFRSVTNEEVAKSRFQVAGWAAYHDQNRQKGKGKGKGPPRYGCGAPAPVLPHVPQAAAVPGVCRDFQRGQCQRGQNCRFSHNAQPAAPIAPPPAPAHSKGAGKGAPPVCLFWQAWGTCNRADCKFAHPPEKKGAGLHSAPPSN